MWEHSFRDLFDKGGWVMWPLLASSVLGLTIILDRLAVFLFFWERLDPLVSHLEPLVRRQQWVEVLRETPGGPLSRVARAYLEQRDAPEHLRVEVVQREGALALKPFETRLRALGFAGQVSPMLGLLGTVTGLVSCFHEVEKAGGQAHPSQLAAGIWEALLTTVAGLVIAIPCLAAYAWFNSRVDALGRNMSHLVSYLDQWTHEAKVSSGSSAMDSK
jgi:biopolymer transport protein ExbB